MWSNYFFKNVYYAPPPQPTSLKISKFWDYRIFKKKKCTNSDFYFLSFWGEKRRLDFSSRDFREKSHYPGCFHLPFFFYQTVCSLYLIAALCHMLTNAATITAAAQWKWTHLGIMWKLIALKLSPMLYGLQAYWDRLPLSVPLTLMSNQFQHPLIPSEEMHHCNINLRHIALHCKDGIQIRKHKTKKARDIQTWVSPSGAWSLCL